MDLKTVFQRKRTDERCIDSDKRDNVQQTGRRETIKWMIRGHRIFFAETGLRRSDVAFFFITDNDSPFQHCFVGFIVLLIAALLDHHEMIRELAL